MNKCAEDLERSPAHILYFLLRFGQVSFRR